MTASPAPEVLYPDIAAHGSLAAALRAEADRAKLSVPFTDKTEYPLGTLGAATAASTLMHRAPLHIGAYTWTRRWSIRGTDSFLGYALIDGVTGDLTEIARVAQAWHDGASLDDIHQAATFVHLTGLLEVPDGDPARLIESKWQLIRTEARERDWPANHALIEAAYAEPALRALYPFTSHTTLRFGSTIPPHYTIVNVLLDADTRNPGQYTVSTRPVDENPARFATAEAAAAAAAALLPPDLGITRQADLRQPSVTSTVEER